MKNKISPSMMCADALNLGSTLKEFEKNGIEYLHIDIMDGAFVPNFTLGTDFVKALKSKTSIPLEYLFINNTREDVYLKYNEYSNVFWDATMDVAPRNMTAKIKNYGVVPAGTYSITLEIQAIDIETQSVATTSSFPLQFEVPTFHELNTYSASPEIKVSVGDAFTKNKKIKNEVSPMIYIRSNTDWILSIDTTDFEKAEGRFYVRTESASSKVTSRLQERALITPDTPEIIIARGIAPAENEYVAVEFSLENPDGSYIPAGEYNYKVKYILKEGKDK